MHKLVDDLMARAIKSRTDVANGEAPVADESRPAAAAARIDASLTTAAAHTLPVRIPAPTSAISDELETSARVVPSVSVGEPFKERVYASDRPEYSSRAWRAEAWRREQERERRNAHNAKTARRGPTA